MGGIILRSNGGIHCPHNAPVLGNAGPYIRIEAVQRIEERMKELTSKIPIKIRIKIRRPTCVLAATGVSIVNIADIKSPHPNIHFAPKRSANVPIHQHEEHHI